MSEIVNNFNDVRVKTDKELVLLRPEVNIGSIAIAVEPQWILSEAGESVKNVDGAGVVNSASVVDGASGVDGASVGGGGVDCAPFMKLKDVAYIPALLKLFDEAIVNARDHAVRMATKIEQGVLHALPVTYIYVTVDASDGTISVCNDGNGMDVAIHPDVANTYIPEVAFGHLRSSTHYDDTEENTFGGQNGLGIKLAYIWSTYGQIETVDHVRKLKYVQTFRDNLDTIEPPVITKCTAKVKPYTKVTFRPDYSRLQTPLTPDMIALIRRRTYDIAAVTPANIKVRYNDEQIQIKKFAQYVDMFIGSKAAANASGDDAIPRVYDVAPNGRWELAVAASPTREYRHVSFVNGIFTYKGGKHVDYLTDQITTRVAAYIEKKKKIRVSTASIKEQLMVFVRCDIIKPKFSSQTKEYLTTPIAQLKASVAAGGLGGGGYVISDAIIEKIAKQLGVMETACAITEAIGSQKVARQANGSKTKRILGIPKLDDANCAGTSRSNECTLILTEGDSAKTAVIAGLSSDDRNYIGVYALKGKLENVRGKSATTPFSEEIGDIMKILGMKVGVKYTSTDALRYGRVMFFTDQDLDGSHIKGLGVNLFHSHWEETTQLHEFIGYMNTPIIKAWPVRSDVFGPHTVFFYNEDAYAKWKEEQPNIHAWRIKYYKGLGTSVKKEFQEYMRTKRFVYFQHTGTQSDNAVDMAFNKGRADDRKLWLKAINAQSDRANTSDNHISYEDFINKELIWFSKYDCERNIPNVIDGLKPSQRKILFGCFKRRLFREIKTAQLAGYISEHTGYHHGEASLTKTIDGMAQSFVGKNNVNYLVGAGQFGSRITGGADAASPRYTYTYLEEVTRKLMSEMDDTILHYLDDDGSSIEPEYYLPVIPMLLINGTKGIGTGTSTEVLQYNLRDIIAYLRARLTALDCAVSAANAPMPMPIFTATPYYEGFTGIIKPLQDRPRSRANATKTNVDPMDSASTSTDAVTGVAAVAAVAPDTKYLIKGVYTKSETTPDTIRVTELPIGFWTLDFKTHVVDLVAQSLGETKTKTTKTIRATKQSTSTSTSTPSTTPIITNAEFNNTDTTISTTITFAPSHLDELERQVDEHGVNGVEKLLKLTTTQTTTNMNLFNARGQLTKYATIGDIMNEYFDVRLEAYHRRKSAMICSIESELVVLLAKIRFINAVNAGEIQLHNVSMAHIIDQLHKANYPAHLETHSASTHSASTHSASTHSASDKKNVNDNDDDNDPDVDAADGDANSTSNSTSNSNYTYLLNMKISSLTHGHATKLKDKAASMQTEIQTLLSTTVYQMWLCDLDALEPVYLEQMEARKQAAADLAEECNANTKGKKSKIKSKDKVEKADSAKKADSANKVKKARPLKLTAQIE